MTAWERASAPILSGSGLAGRQAMANSRALSVDAAALARTLPPDRATRAEVERKSGQAEVCRLADGPAS